MTPENTVKIEENLLAELSANQIKAAEYTQ